MKSRHNAVSPAPDGYLNVIKSAGMTSHDVVALVRRATGQRRVGHTGTLDPGAVGVLPIAVGRATRTCASPVWDSKLYLGNVRFGSATDTDDGDGKVIAEGSPSGVTWEGLQLALAGLLGTQLQRPPRVSAVHVEGERAYARARRGEGVAPAARMVRIDAISVVDWSPPILSMLVQCGSGTYIRSLARDLGEQVGCPAHLASLVRVRVGPFLLSNAVDLTCLAGLTANQGWRRLLYPVDITSSAWPGLIASQEHLADFTHGRPWVSERSAQLEGGSHQDARVYDEFGSLLGLVRATEQDYWQPRLPLSLLLALGSEQERKN